MEDEGMKKIAILIVLAATVMLSHHRVFAQGEAAVPFLLIAPGARNGGIGEAGVALANDPTAIYWNPAGLAFQYQNPEEDHRYEISLMHSKWLPQFNFSDLYYDYGAARFYLEDIGMVGVGLTYLNLGENVWTDENGERLGTFDSYEYAVSLSYATQLQPNLSVGVNAKLIQSNLTPIEVTVGTETGEGTATAFAVDLGVLWYPQYSFLDNRLSLGANLSNFGPAITYIDKQQADPLPTNLRLGLAYTLYDDNFNNIKLVYDTNRMLVYRDSTGADGVIESVFYSSWVKGDFVDKRLKKFTHSFGLEYSYGGLLSLRTGYFYEFPEAGGRKFLTFGGGIGFNMFNIDFSYISASKDHPLSDTMRFSLAVGF